MGMGTARKAALIILIMLMVVILLQGQERLTFTGHIVIPGPDEDKPYTFKGTMTMSRENIEINCSEKIFRPLNTFNAPRQHRLLIDTKEIDNIQFKGERLYIYPTLALYHRYRNIFNPLWKSRLVFSSDLVTMEYQVLIFRLDNPQTAAAGAALIATVNKQAIKLKEKYGSRGTGKLID